MTNRLKDEEYQFPIGIDVNHSRTHQGVAFVSGYSWAESSTRIADNASAIILINPGSEMHARFGVQAGGNAEVQLFENVATSTSTSGNAATIKNKGVSSKVSDATVTYGTSALVISTSFAPTSTGWGSPYPAKFIPGGIGANAGGGGIGDLIGELNLSTAYTYCLRAINRSGVVSTVSMTLDWYEPHNTSTA